MWTLWGDCAGSIAIAFAGRALTDPETRYEQIEKEMLRVVFALQKFDQYIFGRSVTVQSDHKPLVAISNKPLRSAPKRLQGMLLKMQKYDATILYKPGPEMYLADTYFCTTAPKKDHQRTGIPQGLRALGTLNIC